MGYWRAQTHIQAPDALYRRSSRQSAAFLIRAHLVMLFPKQLRIQLQSWLLS